MKQWLAIVAAGTGLVAVWALPPRSERIRAREARPEQRAYEEVLREVRNVHGALQAVRWSDSLSDLAIQEADGGLAFGVPASSAVTSEGVEEARENLAESLRELGPRSTEMVVGVFAVPRAQGADDSRLPSYTWLDRTTFVGTRDGAPYCLEVEAYRQEHGNAALRATARRGLGACRWYAKYGMPGARVQRWLESGGLDFAIGVGEREAFLFPTLFPTRAALFGLNRFLIVNVPLAVQRCVSGYTDGCEGAVVSPEAMHFATRDREELLAMSPVTHSRGYSGSLGPNGDFLFADLEAEFGSDAFVRFWTSTEDVPAAFRAAFGTELGTWVLGWVDDEMGLSRAGPLPSAGSVWLSLLTLIALTAWVSARATRRRLA